MKQYIDLLRKISQEGEYKEPARDNMPRTLSLFGHQFRHDLSTGFPLLTTKKIYWKAVVVELLWFLRGDTNIKYLLDNGVNIWNEDAYQYYEKLCERQGVERKISYELFHSYIKNSKGTEELKYDSLKNAEADNFHTLIPKDYVLGDCGKQYGWLWRSWGDEPFNGTDQIKNLISGLQKSPMSRRHIITAWNPSTIDDMALPACHSFVQFNCRPVSSTNSTLYYLDCQLYQRSADVFLGVPFNIASYALLTHIIAKICNMVPGEFIHTFGDVHIYDNHKEQVEEQLSRECLKLPSLKLSDGIDWEEVLTDKFDYNHLINALTDYKPHPPIKAKLSTGLK